MSKASLIMFLLVQTASSAAPDWKELSGDAIPRRATRAASVEQNGREPFPGVGRILFMGELIEWADPVRAALAHGESAPADFASWPVHECLHRLRIRFGLNRRQLAAKAGVSASLVGRAEKGTDVRLSTLRKLYGALGCRFLALPAGALYELDWRQAHLDNEWLDWKRKNARVLTGA